MDGKNTYSGDDSYFDGRDKELDASYLRRKLCKKKYQLEFEKGEIIIAQGEDVDACYYLEKGYVIAYETVKGRRRIFDAYNSNNLLLCSYAVFDRPCAFFYEARESSVLYSISMEKVRKLLQNDASFTRAVLTQTTRDLMVCQDLLRKSTNHTVGWLVSDWLIVMASRSSRICGGVTYLNDRVTQNQLAEMLFINRITCLKELHHLESLGLIDLQGSHIGILDMDGLIEYRRQCQETKQGGAKDGH